MREVGVRLLNEGVRQGKLRGGRTVGNIGKSLQVGEPQGLIKLG